jgi:excisionase family DNA binding protein
MKFYTTQQATEELGYSTQSAVRNAIKNGTIKAHRIGSFWVIKQREIDRIKELKGIYTTEVTEEN